MNETNTYKRLKYQIQDNFPEFIVVHHSGGTKADPNADTSHHTAEIMEVGHMSAPNYFEGLGYQYVIHKDGQVWRGRPEHYHGAHVKEQGMNRRSIGICLAGNFTVEGRKPTPEQENALKELIRDIQSRYNIPVEKIVPHRYFLGQPPYKDCYGDQLSDTWARDLMTPPPETIEQKKERIIQLIREL